MHVVMSSTPESRWERILPIFQESGWAIADIRETEKPPSVAGAANSSPARPCAGAYDDLCADSSSRVIFLINDAQDLVGWLDEDPDGPIILFHSRPEAVLAEAMERGDDPTTTLHQWREAAEQLLHAHRHNRRRSLLVSAEEAFAQSEAFVSACKKRFGFQLSNALTHSKEAEQAPVVHEIHKLIAAQFVIQSPGLSELLAEIEASSIPLDESSALHVVDCSAAHSKFQQMKVQVDGLQQELGGLRGKCQEEMTRREMAEQTVDVQRQQLEEQKQHLQEKDRACQQLQESSGEQAQKLQDVEKENELLLVQLHQVQEELESYYLGRKEETGRREEAEQALDALRTERKACEKELATAQRRLNRIWQSTSWKVTAPLRVIGGIIKRPGRKLKQGTIKDA